MITSSIAAIFAYLKFNQLIAAVVSTNDSEKTHFTDVDWSDLTACQPYDKSKTLAEKAAWDFVANLPQDKKFELVTINPGVV